MIRIAVVDDEVEVFQLFKIKFKNQIRNNEYCFHFFENGKECYNFIHSRDDIEIIIVFTDINMPEMDGLTLLESLKKFHSEVDVYLVSAYDYAPYRSRADQSGSSGFMAKPFNFDEIELFIKQSIKKHKAKVG